MTGRIFKIGMGGVERITPRESLSGQFFCAAKDVSVTPLSLARGNSHELNSTEPHSAPPIPSL
jgi:hypothetical protein